MIVSSLQSVHAITHSVAGLLLGSHIGWGRWVLVGRGRRVLVDWGKRVLAARILMGHLLQRTVATVLLLTGVTRYHRR